MNESSNGMNHRIINQSDRLQTGEKREGEEEQSKPWVKLLHVDTGIYFYFFTVIE